MATTQADGRIVGMLCRSGGVLTTLVGVENGRARVRDVTGGAEGWVPVLAVEGIDDELAWWVGAPLFMQLEPEVCPGDDAVEADVPLEVDVAPVLAEMGDYERGLLLETLSVNRGVVPDELYLEAVDRGQVGPGHGRYHSDLAVDDVALWCAANPYSPPQPRTTVPDRFTDQAALLHEQVRAARCTLVAISIVELAIQLHNQLPTARYALFSNLLAPDDWLLVGVYDSYQALQDDRPTRYVNARVPHIPDADRDLFAEAAGICAVRSVTRPNPSRNIAIDLLTAASTPEARVLAGRL